MQFLERTLKTQLERLLPKTFTVELVLGYSSDAVTDPADNPMLEDNPLPKHYLMVRGPVASIKVGNPFTHASQGIYKGDIEFGELGTVKLYKPDLESDPVTTWQLGNDTSMMYHVEQLVELLKTDLS